MRPPTRMAILQIKLAAGGWIPVCHINAIRLQQLAYVEVELKRFSTRRWEPALPGFKYEVWMQFRARQRV